MKTWNLCHINTCMSQKPLRWRNWVRSHVSWQNLASWLTIDLCRRWVQIDVVFCSRAWNASVRDVVNAIGDADSTRPGWMPTQVQVSSTVALVQFYNDPIRLRSVLVLCLFMIVYVVLLTFTSWNTQSFLDPPPPPPQDKTQRGAVPKNRESVINCIGIYWTGYSPQIFSKCVIDFVKKESIRPFEHSPVRPKRDSKQHCYIMSKNRRKTTTYCRCIMLAKSVFG